MRVGFPKIPIDLPRSLVFTAYAQPFSSDRMRRVIDKKLSEYFSRMGKKSVKARMKKLSARKRKQIARNAARSRWAKTGKGKGKR